MNGVVMKRWHLYAGLAVLSVAGFIVGLFWGNPPEAHAQGNIFCASNLPCTVTSPWTFQTVTFIGDIAGDTAILIQPATTALTASPFVHIEPNSTIIGLSGYLPNGQPSTPLGWYRSLVGSSAKGTEAGQFALFIPSGYTGPAGIANQVNAISSMVWTQDAGHDALAHSSFAVCDATGGVCWGGNDVVTTYSGNPGHTGQILHGREVDCEANTTGVIINCIQVGAPSSTQTPASANGYDCSKPVWGGWTACLNIEVGAAVGGHAIQLGQLASGVSQPSQDISLQATSSGGGTLLAGINEDSQGNLNLAPGTGGFWRNSLAGSGLQLLSSGGFFTQITNTATAFRSIIFPDASGTALISGNGDGTHSIKNQSLRVAGCTTAASIGGICASDITVTWTTQFADANYTVVCTGSTPTAVPAAPYVVPGTQLAATVHINYFAITAVAASYATVECIAVHD